MVIGDMYRGDRLIKILRSLNNQLPFLFPLQILRINPKIIILRQHHLFLQQNYRRQRMPLISQLNDSLGTGLPTLRLVFLHCLVFGKCVGVVTGEVLVAVGDYYLTVVGLGLLLFMRLGLFLSVTFGL
jgi:hypothetical protein